MTTATSLVEVLFDVPLEIVNGLASGEMVRRGGVIQRASGDNKGEVVAWLKEVGGLARESGSPPGPLVAQLQSLQMATSALAVGQALTLGFSVFSFALLSHKLNVLGRKLDGVLARLTELKQEVAWLDRRHDIALEARLRGALEQGDWAHKGGRVDALVSVRAVLVEVEHHYRALLNGMLDEQRAHRNAELFAAYQGYLALVAVARTRCEVVLDGAEAGVATLRAVQTTFDAIDEGFRGPLRNVGEHLHLLRLGVDAERSLRPALGTMKETIDRVEGYRTELAYCADQGIVLSDWEQIGDGSNERRLVLILPKPG